MGCVQSTPSDLTETMLDDTTSTDAVDVVGVVGFPVFEGTPMKNDDTKDYLFSIEDLMHIYRLKGDDGEKRFFIQSDKSFSEFRNLNGLCEAIVSTLKRSDVKTKMYITNNADVCLTWVDVYNYSYDFNKTQIFNLFCNMNS